MQIDNAASPPEGALRILIVDDDAETRELHSMLLRRWQYVPVVAVGEGEALLADAVAKAKTYRCQIALVDMRLRDNYDKRDWSGLKLAPQLQPSATIIISAFGDHKTAVAALNQYGAATFVGKEDGPEALQEAIVETARKLALGDDGPQVVWSHGLSSAGIRRTLFPDQPDVPDDQADELIRRMFPTAHVVGLTLIEDDDHASDQPAAPRRRSRVFRATVDDQPSVRVVKLGRTEKVRRETHKYDQYVRFGIKGAFRPEKFAEALLWDMGAVAYLYLGGEQSFDSQRGLRTFTAHYRATDEVETILAPLRHFFSDENWGVWYTKEVTSLATSLFEAYDAVLLGKLHRELDAWRADPPEYRVDAIGATLPNPTRWLADHFQESRLVRGRQAVTHGDLHGDNLFVDQQHAWPIDFERTGPGPILRDFVELTQDILTRIAHLGADDLPVVYDLAVGLCAPATPDQPAQLSERVRQHREANRAFRVVSEIQQLASRHTRYDDQREYLWGLLINCLFVLTLLPVTDRRYTVTRLLAAVICGRLERWGGMWPLRGWPRWKQPLTPQPEQFPHGHALLIGVGSYARAYLSVPATACDATALAEVLCDRQTAAYPPEQVTLLTDQEATRTAVLRALDDLAARVARAAGNRADLLCRPRAPAGPGLRAAAARLRCRRPCGHDNRCDDAAAENRRDRPPRPEAADPVQLLLCRRYRRRGAGRGGGARFAAKELLRAAGERQRPGDHYRRRSR